MSNDFSLQLRSPYLIFMGDVDINPYAKTGLGIVKWCPELVAGQLRFAGNTLDLGVPELTIQQAADFGVNSIVVGVAPIGGNINDRWVAVLVEAAKFGLDIISGLHVRLEDFPSLVSAANNSGAQLISVRTPPAVLPIGNGKKRSGQRVLMVGTDCAVGKKYTALSLTKSLNKLGVKATFRATGQTGIMIAGNGIPIDAVVSDFVSGAAELISPPNHPDHWDVIEGQGSLFNPSYAGVSLGLLHGSQPDAFVVCHDATRTVIDSCPHILLPTISECIDLHVRCGKQTNQDIACIGISVNTSGLPVDQGEAYLRNLSDQTGLICIDSVIDSCDPIAEYLVSKFGSNKHNEGNH